MDDERALWIGAGVATLALAAAVYYFYIRDEAQPAPVEETARAPQPRADAAPPPIRNPVPPPAPGEATTPLPPLAKSDPALRDSLSSILGSETVNDLVVSDGIVRRFVITVDNLAKRKMPVQSRPVAPAPGQFRVAGTEENPTLDPENYARYSPTVSLVAKTDVEQLAAIYRRFYPLLQEAYADIGGEGAYFNDRLIEIVDHLLATPEVPGPIELVRPRVFYEFKDRELEALSGGQKLLIRMGPQNAAVVKAKLQELRRVLAAPPEA